MFLLFPHLLRIFTLEPLLLNGCRLISRNALFKFLFIIHFYEGTLRNPYIIPAKYTVDDLEQVYEKVRVILRNMAPQLRKKRF